MAAALTLDILSSLTWVFTDALDLSTIRDSSAVSASLSMATGTGNNQVDLIWHDQLTLASAANDVLNLNALARTIYGTSNPINLVKVKAILVVNAATAAGEDLTIGANATTPFLGPLGGTTPTIKCEAGSPLLLVNYVDGWSTSGANNLKIVNSGASSNTYKIVIAGTSA